MGEKSDHVALARCSTDVSIDAEPDEDQVALLRRSVDALSAKIDLLECCRVCKALLARGSVVKGDFFGVRTRSFSAILVVPDLD